MSLPYRPYEPRRVSFLGLEELSGYRLKSYGIVCGEAAFERERFAAGLALAARDLPAPASAPGRPGVGFVLLHQGRGVDYLILAWWDRENELPVRVFVREDAGWRPARGGEGLCVWDLRVLWHEREAYVNTLLAGADRDRTAEYLAWKLDGYA